MIDFNGLPDGYYWLYENVRGTENTFLGEKVDGTFYAVGTDEIWHSARFIESERHGHILKMEKVEIPPPSWVK